jgi:hypothetical protein
MNSCVRGVAFGSVLEKNPCVRAFLQLQIRETKKQIREEQKSVQKSVLNPCRNSCGNPCRDLADVISCRDSSLGKPSWCHLGKLATAIA